MFIEPCCIAKQLPPVLLQQEFSHFNSNGDWLLTDLMDAVAHLVPSSDMIVAVPQTDFLLLRHLEMYLKRGWIKSLRLLTQKNESATIKKELDSDKVVVACSPTLNDNGMLLLLDSTGNKDSLIIQGPMLIQRINALCIYNAYKGKDKSKIRDFSEAVIPRINVYGK